MRGSLSILTLGLMAATDLAAEPAGTITVTGSATIFVKPDTARVHYSVRVSEPAVDAAKHAASKQATAMDDAIAALKLSGLTTSVGTATYNRSVSTAAARRALAGAAFAPPGAAGGPGGPNAAGPMIAQMVIAQVPLTTTIREKDPIKLRAAVDTLLKTIIDSGAASGAELADADFPLPRALSPEGPRVEWLLEDDAAAQRTVLRAAADKAKANATTLSRELGWDSFKVVSLVDGPAGPREPGGVSIPVARTPAGEVAVSARVTLTCSR
jgi:uncharacterized protein YggE